MAKNFYDIDKEYAMKEFEGEGLGENHLVDTDGDHAACGLALGGSAKVGSGKVTCKRCKEVIKFYQSLKKGVDF